MNALVTCSRCPWRWIDEERPLGPGPIVALLLHWDNHHYQGAAK